MSFLSLNQTADQRGCTSDGKMVASCVIKKWDTILSKEYAFFSDPSLGGNSEALDYVPTFVGLDTLIARILPLRVHLPPYLSRSRKLL